MKYARNKINLNRFTRKGLYLYNPNYDHRVRPEKSWWWVDQDDYMISLGLLPGYDEVKRYSFRRWLPFGQGNIFILHKNPKS
jgi:hypothetical protein